MRLLLSAAFAIGIMAVCARAAGPDNQEALARRRSPVVAVFETARHAVVNISCTETVTVRDPLGDLFGDIFDLSFGGPNNDRNRGPGSGGGGRQFTRTSVGSGFVIHPDGYIVTNAHVVAQTPERKAIFSDGREYDAQIVAVDAQRDLAVLKITTDRSLHTLKLGRSDDLMIGETVIAIGNPLGYQNTVTAGVISAVNRDLNFPNQMKLTGLIQTDASINPGNSGGPLLNVLGELIGVNSAIRGDAQNIGFAIPVDQLREILPDLLDVERRYRLICGMMVDTLNSPRVLAVKPGTPAAKAGVRPGDVLERFGDRPIKEGIDFYIALMNAAPDQPLDVLLAREGQAVRTSMTIERRPAPDGVQLAKQKLGVLVEDLPPDVAANMGLPGATGLLVNQIERNGPADRLGVRRRDVLVAIGRHAVANKDDLGQLLESIQTGDTIPVTLLRVDGWTKLKMYGELRAR
jgi:serine protease Do